MMITRIIAYSQRAPPHCPETSTAAAWHQAFETIPARKPPGRHFAAVFPGITGK